MTGIFANIILVKLSSRPLVTFIIAIFFINLLAAAYLAFGFATLDFHFSYTSNYALDFIWNQSREEQLRYMQINVADILFTISYSLFIPVVLFNVFYSNKAKPQVYVYCLFLPVIVGGFDLAETFAIFLLNYFAYSDGYIHAKFHQILAQVCSIATPIKWLGWLLIIFTYLFGLAWSWATARKKL